MEESTFARKIGEYRWKNGNGRTPLSMERTAEKFGVSRIALSSWLMGRGTPTLKNAVRVASVLGISLDELVGHEVPV